MQIRPPAHHTSSPPRTTTTKTTKPRDASLSVLKKIKGYLAGLVEQLVLKLLDAQNVLEHLVQLVLAEDELRGGAGRHALLGLARVLVAAVDAVELGHPGAEHRLLAQAVDLGQAAHALLDVPLEDLAAVVGREAAALHHLGHAVALQEHLQRGGGGGTQTHAHTHSHVD